MVDEYSNAIMSDRYSELIEQMMEMTEMTEEEKARFMDAYNNIDELRKLDDWSDIDDLNFDFDVIDIEEMDDIQKLLDEIDELPIDDFGGFNLNDLDTEDVADFFNRASDYRYDPEPEEVDVEVDEKVTDQPYHGSIWMEVEDGYEAFIDVPEGITEGDVNISVQTEEITIEDPINESLPTDKIPTEVTSVEVELKDGRLLLRVE